MKKVNLLLIALASVIAFSSCNSNKKTSETENETETIQTIVTVDELLANAEQEIDNVVLLEGVCTHICSHGGKKLFLMGDDDSKTIRVEASDDIGAFKPESVNSIVKVKGTLKEERIDEAYLTQWEARLAEGVVDEIGRAHV